MPIKPIDRPTPDLPPSMKLLDAGTTHTLDECDCGVGPHHRYEGRQWFSDGRPVEMRFGMVPLAGDTAMPRDMVCTVTALIDGKAPRKLDEFTVVELHSVEFDLPPGYIPPAPPRTPEQVDSIRWANPYAVEVVTWGYGDGSMMGVAGTWRWREYKNRAKVIPVTAHPKWAAIFWSHGAFLAYGFGSRKHALDHLAEGHETGDLSPVGIIKVKAEAGTFWRDLKV